MNNEFDDLMDEAIQNIRNDRDTAKEFLNELANQIAQNAENNRALSPVAVLSGLLSVVSITSFSSLLSSPSLEDLFWLG